jgi:hypothetical protein
MNTKIKYVVIIIAFLAIIFSLYTIISGERTFDSFSGIVAGFSLLIALYINKNYKKDS